MKFAKLNSAGPGNEAICVHKSEYEYGLDHVGGIRCCESNKSRLSTCWRER